MECDTGSQGGLVTTEACAELLSPVGRLMPAVACEIRGFTAYPDLRHRLSQIASKHGEFYTVELRDRLSVVEKESDAYYAISQIHSDRVLQL